jgi:hypothetical protein
MRPPNPLTVALFFLFFSSPNHCAQGDRVRVEGEAHGDWQYGYNYSSKS